MEVHNISISVAGIPLPAYSYAASRILVIIPVPTIIKKSVSHLKRVSNNAY